jgi:hypothetical protein
MKFWWLSAVTSNSGMTCAVHSSLTCQGIHSWSTASSTVASLTVSASVLILTLILHQNKTAITHSNINIGRIFNSLSLIDICFINE